MITPQEVFERRYAGRTNGATPVVVEYGWLVPDTVAYELSTNYSPRRGWAITVVAYFKLTDSTKEISELRYFTREVQEAYTRLAALRILGTKIWDEVGRRFNQ
jgi:hypothetical protein